MLLILYEWLRLPPLESGKVVEMLHSVRSRSNIIGAPEPLKRRRAIPPFVHHAQVVELAINRVLLHGPIPFTPD